MVFPYAASFLGGLIAPKETLENGQDHSRDNEVGHFHKGLHGLKGPRA